MNYTEVSESIYVAQPVNDFLFQWEEEGSVEKPITIEKKEGFSEPRTPMSEPRQSLLRSNEILQNFENSADRQLFDL